MKPAVRDLWLELGEGVKIGYHPTGDDDVRAVGIIVDVDDVYVTVEMPDDPGIRERVRYERIRAVEGDSA